jgi:hypothetical protein
MLSQADRIFWDHFIKALTQRRAELERDDFVPLVVVFSKVHGHWDDGAKVGLMPSDLNVMIRPDVSPKNAETALLSAAVVARES